MSHKDPTKVLLAGVACMHSTIPEILSNMFNNHHVYHQLSAMAALPTVHSLTDCADLSKTVLAYLPQFYDVPQLAAQAWHHPELLKSIYLSTNPLVTSVVFSLALAAVVLVISEINRNYSQVDRIWSILPTVYNAHYVAYAHLSGLPTERLDHVLALSCLWSVSWSSRYILALNTF